MVPNERKGQYFHIVSSKRRISKIGQKYFTSIAMSRGPHQKGKKVLSLEFGGLFPIKTVLNYLYSDARHCVKNTGSWVNCIQKL